MKRAGFTMIELIFVIVVLGILSAVALPKFLGVADQAHVGKLKGYVGTLNRTVAPALWAKSISNGTNGAVSTMSTDLVNQITSPAELTADPDLTKCAAVGTAIAAGTGTVSSATVGTATYNVGCIDGDSTVAPHFFLDDGTKVLLK